MEEPPSSSLGTRLPAQDYNRIRRECLRDGKLFEDPYFPASNESLFYSETLPFTPEWKRPGDICTNPKFYTGGASRFDVSQGMLGDCWLVAAIASLTQDRILLNKVIPEGQEFEKGYVGMFHFRFWHFGEWIDLVIDDRLPTHNGKLIFIHSTEENEFWSALLEKAYAKLYGGYESLKGGKTSEALEDFTGGVTESFDIKKADSLYDKILKGIKRSCLMGCSIKATTRDDMEAKLTSGLIKGHAYSVTGATTVTYKGASVKLVRIRNPWGAKEWNGDWGDDSKIWQHISASERQALQEGEGTFKEDGEFWMSFDDFKKHFTDFEICNVSVAMLYEDDSVKNWNSIIKPGSWLGGKGTSGGCRNYPSFTDNPQFIIDLTEDADGDGKCSCLIALMQKHRRKQKKMGVQDLCIGFSVYKAPDDGSDKLTKQWVDYHYSDGTSGAFTNAREVFARFDVDPGRYIVLPCTFKPNEDGDFLLRIFTEGFADDRKAVGEQTGEGEAAVEDPKKAQLKAMFKKLAGADGEVDGEELQDLLTATLASDLGHSVFSLEACRSMITMLDEDKNGTLSYDEFTNLLATVAKWKKMYFKFDRDRSGTLEKAEVATAITSLDYDISPKAMNILFNRFARKRKYMGLDDFCSCLSRVKIMSDTYKKMSRGGSSVHLSKDDFFQITLDA
jgi:Ca2+-binding EF-hand superfamily protein